MLSILRTLPMLRTVFIAVLLAALMAVYGTGSPVYAANVHHRAAARSNHPKTHHAHAARRPTHHSTHHAARHATRAKPIGAARSHTPSRRLQPQSAPGTETHAPEPRAAESQVAEAPAPEAQFAEARNIDAPTHESGRSSAPAADWSVSLRRSRIAATLPLRGSFESLARQNEKTDADGLERILDDDDLNDRIARGMLVPVPASGALAVNGNLPQNRRYCRPWTAAFLTDLARNHQAQFHSPLEVSSAVRTVEYQKRLMETNGNAAQAEGDIASPHLTGATIDIAKQGLNQREIYWMRSRLSALQNAGKIDVEEEFQQSCFHITVYKSYVPARPAQRAVPRTRIKQVTGAPDRAAATALASSGR